MTVEEINDLYIRIAFQCESALAQLVDRGITNKDAVNRYREIFYSSLNEEKLRTSKKISSRFLSQFLQNLICLPCSA